MATISTTENTIHAHISARQRLAMGMAVNLLDYKFDSMFSHLMGETAKRHDEGLLDALNIIEIGQAEMAKMRHTEYDGFDDFTADLVRVDALIKAVNRACGDSNEVIARYVKSALPYVGVMMTMVEVAGDCNYSHND